MIGGRANSMSPPQGVSSKNGGGLLPPATPMFRYQRLSNYSKAISASMLSGAKRIALSATFSNTFCSLSRSPRRSFTMFCQAAVPPIQPSPARAAWHRRWQATQAGQSPSCRHTTSTGQCLYLLHPDVDAHRLRKPKHLDGQRDRHGFLIHIAYIDRLVKVAGHIFLQLGIAYCQLHIISYFSCLFALLAFPHVSEEFFACFLAHIKQQRSRNTSIQTATLWAFYRS